MTDRPSVLLGWQLHNSFGWGTVALNIFCEWAEAPDIAPLMAQPIHEMAIPRAASPARIEAIKKAVAESNNFAAELERLYQSAELRRRVGDSGHAFMKNRTWADHAGALKNIVLSRL